MDSQLVLAGLWQSDLSNKQVAGADCASACAFTSCFTHFTWTSYNSGTF